MIPFPEGLVEGVFEPICRKYDLKVARISDWQVVLTSPRYALYFYTEPNEDTISLRYLDIPDCPASIITTYNLGIFLALKRPVAPRSKMSLATEEMRTHAGLKLLFDHLRTRAEDVLKGEKDWLKDYEPTWSVYPVEREVEAAIRAVLREK